jgi:hypothetical protein
MGEGLPQKAEGRRPPSEGWREKAFRRRPAGEGLRTKAGGRRSLGEGSGGEGPLTKAQPEKVPRRRPGRRRSTYEGPGRRSRSKVLDECSMIVLYKGSTEKAP